MMADFVTPRHSAVMERLRRRIELFRQHHNSCESRYETATLERLELERQQTFALHQRCLQTKAKRSNKHRQPQPSSDQAVQRAPGGGGGGGSGSGSAEHGESGGTAAEQSRNNTLIAVSGQSGSTHIPYLRLFQNTLDIVSRNIKLLMETLRTSAVQRRIFSIYNLVRCGC